MINGKRLKKKVSYSPSKDLNGLFLSFPNEFLFRNVAILFKVLLGSFTATGGNLHIQIYIHCTDLCIRMEVNSSRTEKDKQKMHRLFIHVKLQQPLEIFSMDKILFSIRLITSSYSHFSPLGNFGRFVFPLVFFGSIVRPLSRPKIIWRGGKEKRREKRL